MGHKARGLAQGLQLGLQLRQSRRTSDLFKLQEQKIKQGIQAEKINRAVIQSLGQGDKNAAADRSSAIKLIQPLDDLIKLPKSMRGSQVDVFANAYQQTTGQPLAPNVIDVLKKGNTEELAPIVKQIKLSVSNTNVGLKEITGLLSDPAKSAIAIGRANASPAPKGQAGFAAQKRKRIELLRRKKARIDSVIGMTTGKTRDFLLKKSKALQSQANVLEKPQSFITLRIPDERGGKFATFRKDDPQVDDLLSKGAVEVPLRVTAQTPSGLQGIRAREAEKQIGGGLAKLRQNIIKQAGGAVRRNQSIDILSRLATSLGTTGLTREFQTSFGRVLVGLGIDPKSFPLTDKVAAGEAFRAIAGQLAIEKLEAFPGQISEGEREFVLSISPKLGNTTEGLKLLLGISKKLNSRSIRISKLMDQWERRWGSIASKNNKGQSFDTFLIEWTSSNKLFNKEETARAIKLTTQPGSAGKSKGRRTEKSGLPVLDLTGVK